MSRPIPPVGWRWVALVGDRGATHLVREDATNQQRLQVACRSPAVRVRAWHARDDDPGRITCRKCERYAARYAEGQEAERAE